MTEQQRWLSRKYVAYRMLTNLWFVEAVWLYFYRIFITDQQIGILDGLAFMIGLLVEIPSGAIADKFGRDKLVRIGQVLAGVGVLIQAAGSDFVPFFVGQSIMMIGVALVSGADEALFFDKLKFDKKSTHWRKLVTRGAQAALIGALVAAVAGGWLHMINPRLPWILNGLAFIAAALIIWNIRDERPPKARQAFTPELKSYLSDIKAGFIQFRLPKLWLYVPLILTVQGLFYASGYGLLRLVLLDRFQFDPFWGSIAIASTSLVTVGVLAYTHKNADNLSEKKVLALTSLAAASSLLLSLANLGWWGYAVILVLVVGEHVFQPFMSEIVNNRASDERRATVLSVASFLKVLPYVGLAPVIGYLNAHDRLAVFLIVWALLIVGAVALYLSLRKRDARITLVE